jgi:hypothetical protein
MALERRRNTVQLHRKVNRHARETFGRSDTRKRMIVALARKLLIALWRMTTTGDIPEGVALRTV